MIQNRKAWSYVGKQPSSELGRSRKRARIGGSGRSLSVFMAGWGSGFWKPWLSERAGLSMSFAVITR